MIQTPGADLQVQGVERIPPWAGPFLAFCVLLVIAATLVLPLVRAWARRIEGGAANAALADEMARMRERIAELELAAEHMHEIDERLDFAERLLAQRGDAPQLPLHRTPV